jgi:hypothetical protein
MGGAGRHHMGHMRAHMDPWQYMASRGGTVRSLENSVQGSRSRTGCAKAAREAGGSMCGQLIKQSGAAKVGRNLLAGQVSIES